MKWIGMVIIEVLSWFTGRAVWLELAAWIAEKQGNRKEATEFRNAAWHERLKRS